MKKQKKNNKAGALILGGVFALLVFGSKRSGSISPGSGSGSGSAQSSGGIKSKYYTIEDVQRSQIAVDNNITEQFGALTALQKRDINDFIWIVLDPLSDALGGALDIESWWRSPKVNDLAGGVANSYHEKGVAIDFKFKPGGGSVIDNSKVIKALYNTGLPFTELIFYGSKTAPKSLHLAFDYKDPVAKEILFKKPDGSYEVISKEFIYQTFLT